MKLILFANFFPCKKAEPFLLNEFKTTVNHASAITTFTLYGQPEAADAFVKSRANCLKPVLHSASDKKQLFMKGFFNLAPVGAHLSEFFSKRIFFSPGKFYWWFVSLLVTRAVLSSSAYKELKAYLSKNPETVLYFYWGDNLCWMLPYLQKDLKQMQLKSVIRFHGSDLYEELKASCAPLRSRILEIVSCAFAISDYGHTYLGKKYPQFTGKIKVSRLGVTDHGINPFNASVKRLISVSNVVLVKRVHLIFEALQLMNDDMEWHHFGDGPLMPDLKQLTARSRSGLRVTLHGHVDHNTLDDFLKSQSVDMLINVSSSEGVPVSIMEAFSYGIPVVATAVGGTPELVNPSNGALIGKDFAGEELASAIAGLLNSETRIMEQMRKRARQTFEQLCSTKNFDDFYLELKAL